MSERPEMSLDELATWLDERGPISEDDASRVRARLAKPPYPEPPRDLRSWSGYPVEQGRASRGYLEIRSRDLAEHWGLLALRVLTLSRRLEFAAAVDPAAEVEWMAESGPPPSVAAPWYIERIEGPGSMWTCSDVEELIRLDFFHPSELIRARFPAYFGGRDVRESLKIAALNEEDYGAEPAGILP